MDRQAAGSDHDRECGRLLHIFYPAGTAGLRFRLGACHDRAVLPVGARLNGGVEVTRLLLVLLLGCWAYWSMPTDAVSRVQQSWAIRDPKPLPKKTPSRFKAEAFIQNYFAALSRHDFQTAKRSLDPKLDPKWSDGYEQYWQQFEPGSLSITVQSIATDAQGFSKVKFLRRGKFNGVTVQSRWIYVVADRGSDFRINSISLIK